MSKYPKEVGEVVEISSEGATVKCPMCGREQSVKHNHTDEGSFIKLCEQCGNRFTYKIEPDQIYKEESL